MEDVPTAYEKNEDGEFVEASYQPFNGGGVGLPEDIDYDFHVYYGRNRQSCFKRYEEGDITEVITEIQEEPTITKSGQTVADEGKAFKSVRLPNSCAIISFIDPDVIEPRAFSDCENLSSIIIPDNVKLIGDSAFEGCSNLTSVEIPDSVTSIGSWAFAGCENLTNLVLSKNITKIDEAAFSFCGKLTNINLPSSLKEIGKYAFDGCESLESIVIPNGITILDRGVFHRCQNLKSITIPESVVTIIGDIFRETLELTINYCGSEEQWSAIFRGDEYDTDDGLLPENCVINYNYKPE